MPLFQNANVNMQRNLVHKGAKFGHQFMLKLGPRTSVISKILTRFISGCLLKGKGRKGKKQEKWGRREGTEGGGKGREGIMRRGKRARGGKGAGGREERLGESGSTISSKKFTYMAATGVVTSRPSLHLGLHQGCGQIS